MTTGQIEAGLGRRARKKERTRRALLDAGLSLFAERGLHSTRVEDITDRCDVAKGVFYNYFESKDALAAELIARGVATLEEGYFGDLPTDGSLEARIAEQARRHERFLDEHPEYALLLHQARGLLQLRAEASGKLHTVMAEYLGCIGRHLPLAGGRLAAPEVLLDLAAAFAGAIAGHRSYLLAAGLRRDSSTSLEVVSTGLAQAIRSRGG